MPYDIELPNGELVEVPDGVDPKAALAKIKASQQYGKLFKNEKGGFGRAAVAGLLNSGLGSLDNAIGQGIGKWLGREDITNRYAERRNELGDVASGIFTPTSKEHVAAAKSRGFLPGLKASADRAIIEPVGGVLGGMVPVVGATAVGGPAAGMGVALAQNASETMDRYVEQGKPVETGTSWLASLPMAAIDVFTASRLLTGAGAVEKAREAAAKVAPKVLAGEMTRDQAIKAVRSTAKNMLSEIGKNAATGVAGENAQTVMGRSITGQSLTDQGAIDEYIDNAKTMAVIGGAGGAFHGARAKGSAVRNEIDPAVNQRASQELQKARDAQLLAERMDAEALMGPDRRVNDPDAYTGPERRGVPKGGIVPAEDLPAVSDLGPDRRAPAPYQGDQLVGPDRRAPSAPPIDRRNPDNPRAFVDGADRRWNTNPLDTYYDTTPRDVTLPDNPGQRSVEPPEGFVRGAVPLHTPSPFLDVKGPDGPTVGFDWDSNSPQPDVVNTPPVQEPVQQPALELSPPPTEQPVAQNRRAGDAPAESTLTTSDMFAGMVRRQAPTFAKLAGHDLSTPTGVQAVTSLLKKYRSNVERIANDTPENQQRLTDLNAAIDAMEGLLVQAKKQPELDLRGGKNAPVATPAVEPVAANDSDISSIPPEVSHEQSSPQPIEGVEPDAGTSVGPVGVRGEPSAVPEGVAALGQRGHGLSDGVAGSDVQGAPAVDGTLTQPATPTAAKVVPFDGSLSVGPQNPQYADVKQFVLQAVGAGKFVPFTAKNGEALRLVNLQGNEEGRAFAVNTKGEIVGDLSYSTSAMEDGGRFNPDVYVDEAMRRQGVATALYDLAEETGGLIPDVDQSGQIRTDDGAAFRDARAGKSSQQSAPQPRPTRDARQTGLEAALPNNSMPTTRAIRNAVDAHDFGGVADVLAASQNPIVQRIGEAAKKVQGVRVSRGKKGENNYQPNKRQVTLGASDENTAAHELAHVLTLQALDEPTPQQKIHVKRMTELFDFVRAKMLKEQGIAADEFQRMADAKEVTAPQDNSNFLYAITNVKEFVAEGFSNAAFQRYLANTKYQNKTAWSRFVETVARLLGLQNDNALTEFLAAGTNLIETEQRIAPKTKKVELRSYPGTAPTEPNRGPLETLVRGTRQLTGTPRTDLKSRLKNFGDKLEHGLFDSNWGAMRFLPRAWTEEVLGQRKMTGLALMEMSAYAPQIAETSLSRGAVEMNAEGFFEVREDPHNNMVELQKRVAQLGLDKVNGALQNLNYAERLDRLDAQKQQAQQHINRAKATIASAAKLPADKGFPIISKAKHVIAEMQKVLDEDFDVPANVTAQSMADARADLVSDPVFREVVDIVKAINDQNIKTLEQGGIITPETANLWRQNQHYVPMWRIMDADGTSPFASRSNMHVPTIKGFEGSTRDVNDILENLTRQRLMVADAAMTNTAKLRTLKDLALVSGNPAGVKKLPTTTRPSGAKNVVSVKENGVPVHYIVEDALAFDTFQGIVEHTPGAFMTAVEKVTQIFRNSLILAPTFITKSLFRDNLDAWAYGMTNSSFATTLAKSTSQLATQLPSIARSVRTNQPIGHQHAVTRYGITGHREATTLTREINNIIRANSPQPTAENWAAKADSALRTAWKAWEAVASEAEVATRNQVFHDAFNRTGSLGEGAMAAMNTMNFRRRGAWQIITTAKMVVPFFNSNLQGIYKAYRTIVRGDSMGMKRENARRMIATQGFKMMATASLMAALMADDDDYKDVPMSDKIANIILPLGNGTFVKLPLNFELGSVFWALPQRLIEFMNDDINGRELKAALQSMVLHNSPPFLPQVAKPIAENYFNKSIFTGNPLESAAQQKLQPGLRVNDNTSGVAAELGGATNMSPIKIQNILEGYFGTLGDFALQVADGLLGLNDKKPSVATNRMPYISSFVVDPNRSNARNNIYDLKAISDEVFSTANKLHEDGDMDRLQDYLDERGPTGISNRKMYEYREDVNAIAKVFAELNAQERAVKASDMPPEQKRREIDALRQKGKEFAKEIEPRMKEAFSTQ